MKLKDFSYALPRGRIAQRPLEERDASRLLLLDRKDGGWRDVTFRALPELVRGNETIVFNNARVFPARLLGCRRGLRAEALGRQSRRRREYLSSPIEVLLVRGTGSGGAEEVWEALVRPGRKVRVGEVLEFGQGGELRAEVVGRGEYGLRTLRFESAGEFRGVVERLGHIPLPPYIDRADEPDDRGRYQTVLAQRGRAVAAPTAGLHFTQETLAALEGRGCELVEITLEVGYGTFQPVRTQTVEKHTMQGESYEIPPAAAEAIARARAERRPILAVGTTVVRALEDSACRQGQVQAGRGEAELYIYPGYEFKVVDQLLTNFHLPCSSLLILVCAFAGRENVLRAYRHAVEAGYRFYSYGDAMLVR